MQELKLCEQSRLIPFPFSSLPPPSSNPLFLHIERDKSSSHTSHWLELLKMTEDSTRLREVEPDANASLQHQSLKLQTKPG